MNIGQRIKQAREEAHVSVEAIAKAAKVSRQAVYQWENGNTKSLKASNILALSKVLGVTPEWLNDGKDKGTKHNKVSQVIAEYAPEDDAAEVALAFSRLSPLKKQMYRDAIFRDAATESLMPWLQARKPNKQSYEDFEARVVQEYNQHLAQLKLPI